MKIPFLEKKRHLDPIVPVVMLAVVSLILFSGIAMASSGGEHGGPKGWVATDTYRVMNFVVLAVALFFLLKKPVKNALNARIKGIQNQLDELEARKKAAEVELAEYQSRLSRLEEESEKIVNEYVRQGQEAKARILKEAEQAAEKIEVQAKRTIEHEFSQAKMKLQEEILEKALVKAEQMITKKITEKDQNRIVDEYLKKVVA